ncbi:hypothetical protein SASPL_105236 [Salvia splendens]|uniref:SWIM-type domain-containing protein n=1 Tax=Salvia splendens TaxID=180675 RepID=A0A8X8YP66_SALSN|nr:hypothetical protein SASPL_105236 [Salvia splendens]
MNRICLKRKVAHKYTGAICSKIIKKLEKYKELSSNCWATEAGARKYSGDVWEKLYVVDLDVHTCSCCQWKFFGIPCQHIIPCILQERKNPEEFVQEFYNLDRFKVAYGHVINPLRDIDDYEPAGYLPMQPPPVKVMRGRKQKRKLLKLLREMLEKIKVKYSEVCVSMVMRRNKLAARRKSAKTSQEHQDISCQPSNVEN